MSEQTEQTSGRLQRTPLYDLHKSLGAQMVPSANYEMPVQYPAGIIKEHLHTREKAGLFDVSHMGQIRLSGNVHALERLCPIDIESLRDGQQCYTFFTNEFGGILDDIMVSREGGTLRLVVNASRKIEDIAHLRANLSGDCRVEEMSNHALLALQGPLATEIIARFFPLTQAAGFMCGAPFTFCGAGSYVTRSGYTGEDGFEISVPSEHARLLAEILLLRKGVAPAGLGARDSLRLEAGMCLYGHDINETTTPVEAGLSWAIAKARREGSRQGGFPGEHAIFDQLRHGALRKRVGLVGCTKIPIREGSSVFLKKSFNIGTVTSGGFSPTLGRPIAMAYIEPIFATPGTKLYARVRNKKAEMEVVPLPFVPHKYVR